jgi:hypothetical protein
VPGRTIRFHNAHLVQADETRLILSGYECIADVERETHFGQTWVLCNALASRRSRFWLPFPG